jgi:hypothetical protein
LLKRYYIFVIFKPSGEADKIKEDFRAKLLAEDGKKKTVSDLRSNDLKKKLDLLKGSK